MSGKNGEYPPWMPDKILWVLRQHIAGLTREEIRRKLGYSSISTFNRAILFLLDDGQIRTTLRGPGGEAAKLVYIREDRDNVSLP